MTRTLLLLAWVATAPALPIAAQQSLTARDSALQALSRLAWGPTAGLVDSIARTGVMRWIEVQLAVTEPGDRALALRERAFPVLRTPSEELVRWLTARTPPRPATRDDDQRRELRALAGQLPAVTVLRAVEAQNQLAEVMTDFWFNHFNVVQNKGLDRAMVPAYVEETIRRHSLGRFEDLLIATARSPAMLFYLDNVQSVAPGATPPQLERLQRARAGRSSRFARQPRVDSLRRMLEQRRPTGLNENYARELLELHTLGVDGGYTQRDVTEVARILTGWGIAPPRDGAGFEFHDWAHDRGAKTVLGSVFPPGGGEDEGLRLLRLLSRHSSTMHHVSGKLCDRLVSDLPPDGCVDAGVAAWKRSDGDIREVLRAIVRAPDFWAPAAMAGKVKTPLEFVVSAVRAVGGEPDTTPRLAMQVARLGQPLFLQSAPTGYPETQEDWVNSGALLARMNFAMALASGRLPGVSVHLDRVIPLTDDRDALVSAVDRVILSGRMSEHTRTVIAEQLKDVSDPVHARALAVGLALGGPEFQKQ